jgi:hypothetical protein
MFGLNDNGSQSGGTPPAGAPPVVPNTEPAAPADMTMAMPMPDQSTVASAPTVPDDSPTTTPAAVPDAAPTTDPSMAEPLLPDPLTTPADSSTDMTDYSATDSPQISSNYDSKPGSTPPTLNNEDELLDIKKQALNSLAPLVNELEQTPEEKFKTTMMLIQASDNADLVKDAFTSANAISDEKARAQALLDVVNEINYFTQAHHDTEV